MDSVLSEAHRSLVIVGGGAAGIELAFAFRARFGPDVGITLVSKHRIDCDQALKAGATRIRKVLDSKRLRCWKRWKSPKQRIYR